MEELETCEHTIGLYSTKDGFDDTFGYLVFQKTEELWFLKSNLYDKNHHIDKYKYCPDCGEKIDWEVVEEILKNV